MFRYSGRSRSADHLYEIHGPPFENLCTCYKNCHNLASKSAHESLYTKGKILFEWIFVEWNRNSLVVWETTFRPVDKRCRLSEFEPSASKSIMSERGQDRTQKFLRVWKPRSGKVTLWPEAGQNKGVNVTGVGDVALSREHRNNKPAVGDSCPLSRCHGNPDYVLCGNEVRETYEEPNSCHSI